mgnify:CR=1 FL=1
MILSIFWTNWGKQSSKNAPNHTPQRSDEKATARRKKVTTQRKKTTARRKKVTTFSKAADFRFIY